jgi:hypothetical protein
METSGDMSNNKEIEKIVSQLNCPRALKCYQARQETFAKPKQTGEAVCQLECLEITPLECPFAQFSGAARSYVCTCLVRIYIAGKMSATKQ